MTLRRSEKSLVLNVSRQVQKCIFYITSRYMLLILELHNEIKYKIPD
jgi:hypothetical protein